MNKIVAITGNHACSYGAALSRPEVIAAYPITPQSSVVEKLSNMIADGELDCKIVEVESEHSAMSVVQGATMGGARAFTATSSQGLALMYEPYFRMSTLRLPMVMGIVNREMTSPEGVWGGQQDSISVRDAGWIQVYVENNQEILDMIIQGYKITENKDVLIPLNVCYDGFYLSHLTERVIIPEQDVVDGFVGSYDGSHCLLDPEKPIAVDPLTPGPLLMKYRESHLKAMQEAKKVIADVDKEFEAVFGRSYGGMVEEYRCDDAELILITMGSMTGTAREVVDMKREQGIKAGLLKVRFMRPFPTEQVREVLKDVKAFAVVDRNVCFGWNTGCLYMEINSAISKLNLKITSLPVIGGLGGSDITIKDFEKVVDYLEAEKNNVAELETFWLHQ